MKTTTIYQQIRLEIGTTSIEKQILGLRWFHKLLVKVGWNVHIVPYMTYLRKPEERWGYTHWQIKDFSGIYEMKDLFGWFFGGLEGEYYVRYREENLGSNLKGGTGYQTDNVKVLFPLAAHLVETHTAGLCLIHVGDVGYLNLERQINEGSEQIYSVYPDDVEELLTHSSDTHRILGLIIKELELGEIREGYRKEYGNV